jgi:hypothetical protein
VVEVKSGEATFDNVATKGNVMCRHPHAIAHCARGFVGALLVILCAGASLAEPARHLVLFTPAEAERLRVSEAEWTIPRRTRAAGVITGPRIEIKAPDITTAADGPVIQTNTPASLTVVFEANGAEVDMTSLAVTARKGIFSKSLTDLLKPYVRGTSLQVDGVAIPSGRFLIEIAIADKTGVRTAETYRLEVNE